MSETEGDFDEIWTFVEEKLGPVPTYIKNILQYCGFNNGLSIATIDDSDIQHMVCEVRKGKVSNYFKPPNGTNDVSKDVLEGSTKDEKNFEFSRGHLKFLMVIVKFLNKYAKENGPDSFNIIKQKKKPKINKPKGNNSIIPRKRKKYLEDNEIVVHASEMGNDMDKHKNILLQKMLESLKFHTPKLNAENKSKIEEKMAADQLVIVKMGESKDNPESEDSTKIPKPKASMCCPYCSKSIKVFYESSWKSTNFDRHLYLIHYEEPPGTSTEAVKIGSQNGEIRDKPEDISTDAKATDDNKISVTDATDMTVVIDSITVDASQNDETNVVNVIAHAAEVTDVIEIDSDDNISEVTDANLKGVTAEFKNGLLDNMPTVRFPNVSVKSKNLVCYSESEDSEFEVDGHMERKNQSVWCGDSWSSESEWEAEPRKIPYFKGGEYSAKIKPFTNKAERESGPSTSRQVLCEITNKKRGSGGRRGDRSRTDWKKERETNWNKYF